MTDAPTQSPAKKRRWPLWLMLAVLIAGLAATQVQSLRVALLRVLVLNGPDPARGWAEQRLINEGPVGAPVFLELVLRSYWRISKGQELEAIDELENAFVSYESCLEKEPESVLGAFNKRGLSADYSSSGRQGACYGNSAIEVTSALQPVTPLQPGHHEALPASGLHYRTQIHERFEVFLQPELTG
jgi:hypothetical protein